MREVSRPTRMNIKDHNDVYTSSVSKFTPLDRPHLLRAQRDLNQEGTLNICRYLLSLCVDTEYIMQPIDRRRSKKEN